MVKVSLIPLREGIGSPFLTTLQSPSDLLDSETPTKGRGAILGIGKGRHGRVASPFPQGAS